MIERYLGWSLAALCLAAVVFLGIARESDKVSHEAELAALRTSYETELSVLAGRFDAVSLQAEQCKESCRRSEAEGSRRYEDAVRRYEAFLEGVGQSLHNVQALWEKALDENRRCLAMSNQGAWGCTMDYLSLVKEIRREIESLGTRFDAARRRGVR